MAWQINFNEEVREAYGAALLEVFVVPFLSLVPLLGIAYYQYVVQDNNVSTAIAHHQSLADLIYQNTAAGQLAFYAIANWAAVAWLCGLEKRVHIPGRPVFIAFCIVGFTYCGILIAITAATSYRPTGAVTVPSAITYLISILCYLLLTAFEKLKPPSAESTNHSEIAELHRKVNELRGGENG